ncbi:RNA polymerase II transcription elongation factor-domain-containing protein [Mycena sp. CBHHK59/15]|nr:RNA polymerase II transcription elongation factor-domain-containing protein [Mycena sp. CBHHK59/15]
MASSANAWMPAHGRHEVQIGPSLNKALKSRKGGPPPQVKRTGPPEKDFYSFRYNFKPPSVDPTKPGTIEVSRSKDATNVIVEHPSSQPGEGHVFIGNETTAKELDCVLIYDEETGSYKLEKLESYIVLSYDRKTTASLPASAPNKDTAELEAQLSAEDAEGEPEDDEMPNFAPPQREEEEEEEEDGELEEISIRAPLPPPPVPKPPRALKAPPPSRPPPEAAPAPRAKPPAKSRKPAAPPPPPPPRHVDADSEDLEFGRPATKRTVHSPPPAPAAVLSFPGPSASYVAPPAPASPAAAAQSDSEDDDWDEVPLAGTQAIDLDFEMTLEAELEAEMAADLADSDDDGDGDVDADADEDFLAAALPPDSAASAAPTRPLSLRQLAGGGDSQDEDEYSSSDESDDD